MPELNRYPWAYRTAEVWSSGSCVSLQQEQTHNASVMVSFNHSGMIALLTSDQCRDMAEWLTASAEWMEKQHE